MSMQLKHLIFLAFFYQKALKNAKARNLLLRTSALNLFSAILVQILSKGKYI